MWALVFLWSVLIHSVQAQTTLEMTNASADAVSNCGGYLYGSSDNFNSPNYPNSYPNNIDCVWYIRPSSPIIQLDFYDVNTECGFDDIYVYDGSNIGDRLLERFCSTSSTIFHSTGSYLTVRFRTDGSVTNKGFRASYRVVSRGLCKYNCGYQVGQCSCSPDCEYRGNCCSDYQTYCSSTTETPVTVLPSCRYNCGYNMGSCSCASSCQYYGNCCHDYNDYCYQTSHDPATTGQPSCRYNCGYNMGSCSCASSCQYYGNCCHDYNDYCYQTTYDPPTTGQPSCRYNCGYNMGSCSCASSCQYYGNCCHDYNDYCYHTTSQPVRPTTVSNCGGYLYGSSDYFNSPNYPNSYPNNLDCVWYIRPGRQIIQLDFYDVNTECRYDDIYVYDGSGTGSRLLGVLCNTSSTIFHSTGSYLTVRFRTDGSITNKGFRASYRVVSRGLCKYNCGYQVGQCSCSPDCEYRGNCCSDYQTYCGGNTTDPLSCQHNCGSHLGNCSCTSSCQYYGNCCHDYYSYCGATTNSPTTGQPSCRYNCGYHMGSCSCTSSCQHYGNCCHDYHYYCAATTTPSDSCGGSLFGSGIFSSPNHPSYYYNNAYCVWQLRTTDDQRIFLAFTDVELENCCSCDYIAIYDGPSVSSPLLGKVCNDSRGVFYSSSKYMTVLFKTDYSVVGRGFKADFMSSLQPSSGRVDCSSDNMNIVIEKSYLNSLGYDGHSLYLNDPNCRPRVSTYQVVFSFPLNKCGNIRQTVGDRILYTNHISAYTSTQGEITRQSHLKMNITCLMEPDSTSQIAFIVDHGTNSSITGLGRYNTSMAFYTSSSFYEKVTQVPYKVSLNQHLYVQVGLRWNDSSLILFLDTCVASPTPFDFHTRAYYLVRDGCHVDDTYRPITTGTQSVARFSFRAFQFLRGSEAVYIQCKVVICLASDSNSRCRRGCSRRAVRGLESEHESQTLVAGPIQLKDSEKKKEEPENQNKA